MISNILNTKLSINQKILNKHYLLLQQINPPQLQLPSNHPPRPTQIPAQPVANPNNRADRPAYSVDEGTSYPILPL